LGGRFNWRDICAEAAATESLVDADFLWQGLRDATTGLLAIPDLARDYDFPDELFSHNKLRFAELDKKLKAWDLH